KGCAHRWLNKSHKTGCHSSDRTGFLLGEATNLAASAPKDRPGGNPIRSGVVDKPISRRRSQSNPADPLPVFPNSFERSQIAYVENVFGGGEQVTFLRGLPRIAGVDCDALEHARITVAVNHAARAAIPDEFGLVPVINVAHRRLP